jgi:hypothetical protein
VKSFGPVTSRLIISYILSTVGNLIPTTAMPASSKALSSAVSVPSPSVPAAVQHTLPTSERNRLLHAQAGITTRWSGCGGLGPNERLDCATGTGKGRGRHEREREKRGEAKKGLTVWTDRAWPGTGGGLLDR